MDMTHDTTIDGTAEDSVVNIAPIPRVSIQAFCETSDIAGIVHAASTDRRMSKAMVKVQMGGGAAAVAAYQSAPTPNVIVIEARGERQNLLDALDRLAEFCDAATKVLVIGHVNDVILYRELMRRGVSDYLIAPVGVVDMLRTLSELFTAPGADPVGRVIAVIGAKGGVGASTVAHNIAWAATKSLDLSAVIADLDVPFGTAGLDFNQDPPQGIADALNSPERLDQSLIDRLLSRCSDNLSLLAAPAMVDRTCDYTEAAFDPIIDLLRTTVPCIVLDVPHVWSGWVRRTLVGADEIVIVAAPELASLRNTKNLYDNLRQARPNDRQPKVVLNLVGMPKRPEISAADFAKAIGTDIAASIPFDAALFGTAANNGQMIAEVQAGSKPSEIFTELAAHVMNRAEPRRARRNLLDPILSRLSRRKA
jgi:pilus assembly protein CpaE